MTPQSTGMVVLLILLGVVAALVVAGMIYGRRLAHQRHRAITASEERAEEAGVEPVPEGDPAAAETLSDPVAKEPDPDFTIVATVTKPVRAPKPTPIPVPVPTPKAAPAPKPASDPAPKAPPEPESEPAPNLAGALALTTIKGLGPKVAAMMAERGITRVDQVAALTPAEASELDIQLGAFTGRMARDRWIDQAKLLASGDTAAYEAAFGKLG